MKIQSIVSYEGKLKVKVTHTNTYTRKIIVTRNLLQSEHRAEISSENNSIIFLKGSYCYDYSHRQHYNDFLVYLHASIEKLIRDKVRRLNDHMAELQICSTVPSQKAF